MGLKLTPKDKAQISKIQYLDNIQYEFMINSMGQEIRKCCASCAYKTPKELEGDKRFCIRNLGEKKVVHKRDYCSSWRIAEWADKLRTYSPILPNILKTSTGSKDEEQG